VKTTLDKLPSNSPLLILKIIPLLLTLFLTSCATTKSFGPYQVQGKQLKVRIKSKVQEITTGASAAGVAGTSWVGLGSKYGVKQSQFRGHVLVENVGLTTVQGGKIILTVDWGGQETSKTLNYPMVLPKKKAKVYFVMTGPLSNNIVWHFTIH